MNPVYISFGSNINNRHDNLKHAIKLLIQRTEAAEIKISSIYETKPVEMVSGKPFLNGIITFNTFLDPFAVLYIAENIESEMGRKNSEKGKKLNRIIDLDIIFYNNEIIYSPELCIPHPCYSQRIFVLTPLNELNPGLKDPVNNRTIGEILRTGKFTGQIIKKTPLKIF
ncbi:MAG TPA: 2-amino-4-hydroxy-6-hydroxymethyldihydropteridine diphosphokinase [Firmicutes bacterium]|nr:2-amino-4-hydroxy-6-hydroxymethyldihydropteridine diphosphokinase [Bacillota bacterium]